MNNIVGPLILILLFVVPAIAGGWLAYGRGRNPLLWGTLCCFFPFFLMAIWFQKPLKEVPGHFRRCQGCGDFIRWQLSGCPYCGRTVTEQPSA